MVTAIDIGTLIARIAELDNGRPVIARTRTSVRRRAVLSKQGANAEEIARRLLNLA